MFWTATAALCRRTVSIDITGTNDVPIVAAADVTGAVTELVTPVGNLTDSGTIAFTDVDLTDAHSISAITPSAGALGTLTASVTTDTTGTGLGGVVTWNYSVAASAVEYLAKDQHKVETFTFMFSDGNGGVVSAHREHRHHRHQRRADRGGGRCDRRGHRTRDPGRQSDRQRHDRLYRRRPDRCAQHQPAITPSAGALGTLTASVSHRHDRHRPWWRGDLELQRCGLGGGISGEDQTRSRPSPSR